VYFFELSEASAQGFAVRSVDGAGNVEPLNSGANTASVNVWSRLYLPVVRR